MNKQVSLSKLNTLLDINFEAWSNHGIHLKAASANANGIVNSGILSTGQHFYRKYLNREFTLSEFVFSTK